MAKLEDLIRQRELMARHLAWLDQEIAAEGGPSALNAKPALLRPASAQVTPSPASEPEKIAAAVHRHPVTPPGHPPEIPDAISEEFLEQYQNESKSSPSEARKGCLILFLSVLAVLIVGVVLVYLFKYR